MNICMNMCRCTECGKIAMQAPLECVMLGEEAVDVIDFGDLICGSCARRRRELIEKIYEKKKELELLQKNCGGVL